MVIYLFTKHSKISSWAISRLCQVDKLSQLTGIRWHPSIYLWQVHMDSHMWSLFQITLHAKVCKSHESIHIRPKLSVVLGIQWMLMSLLLPVKMASYAYLTSLTNKFSQSKLLKDISRRFTQCCIVQIWETSLLHVVMIERSEYGGLTVIQIQCPFAVVKV